MATSINYPNTLSYAINDLVTSEKFTINTVLEMFQFNYNEPTLLTQVTWKMRTRVLDQLLNECGPRDV